MFLPLYFTIFLIETDGKIIKKFGDLTPEERIAPIEPPKKALDLIAQFYREIGGLQKELK